MKFMLLSFFTVAESFVWGNSPLSYFLVVDSTFLTVSAMIIFHVSAGMSSTKQKTIMRFSCSRLCIASGHRPATCLER
jgi:hypothetical protein